MPVPWCRIICPYSNGSILCTEKILYALTPCPESQVNGRKNCLELFRIFFFFFYSTCYIVYSLYCLHFL